MMSLTDLPAELLDAIVARLPGADAARLAPTCIRLADVVGDSLRRKWLAWLAVWRAEKWTEWAPALAVPLPVAWLERLLESPEDLALVTERKWNMLAELAACGNLAWAQRMHALLMLEDGNERFRPHNIIHAFHDSCTGGHLECAQWVARSFDVRPCACDAGLCYSWDFLAVHVGTLHCGSNTFVECCEKGHRAVVQWLAANFLQPLMDRRKATSRLCPPDSLPFEKSCEHGHLAVAQWLDEFQPVTQQKDIKEALRLATQAGHTHVTNWLTGRFAARLVALPG